MPRVKRNIQDGYNTSFAKRLRELIDDKEITQNQLSHIIGKTRQAINNYTLGNTAPDSDTLIRLSEYFGVSVDYLLGLSDVKTTDKDIKYICDYTGLSEKAVSNLHSIIPKRGINLFLEKPLYFMQVITLFDMYRLDYEKYVRFKEKCVTKDVIKQDIKEIAYNSINLKDKADLSEYKLAKAFETLIKQCVNSLVERENKVNESFEYFDYFASSKTLDNIEKQLFCEKLLEGEVDNVND